MRLNRRQLSVITGTPPKPDPAAGIMAKVEAIEARLAGQPAPPAPAQPYDDRALMERLDRLEKAVAALAAAPAKFTFNVVRNDRGQIAQIEVERPDYRSGAVWRK